ncbi:MAG: hypothetical protein R2827_07395 [Bdellovibrionales bacterium]
MLVSQDLTAHGGTYFELYSKVALGQFYKDEKTGKAKVQPGFFFAFGGANEPHNRYLYGDGAASGGVTNIRYGLSIASPAKSDVFWPVIRITRFELLGDENKSAALVRETSGWHAEATMVWKVF